MKIKLSEHIIDRYSYVNKPVNTKKLIVCYYL